MQNAFREGRKSLIRYLLPYFLRAISSAYITRPSAVQIQRMNSFAGKYKSHKTASGSGVAGVYPQRRYRAHAPPAPLVMQAKVSSGRLMY
jgi:hypothetical protein